jgi:hypothetical protein
MSPMTFLLTTSHIFKLPRSISHTIGNIFASSTISICYLHKLKFFPLNLITGVLKSFKSIFIACANSHAVLSSLWAHNLMKREKHK